MNLKVGDKVRVKSKEWYDQQNFINVAQCVLDCCGKVATITEVKANGYSLDIGSKNIRWVESCIEPISDGYVSTDEKYGLYIPSDEELKKSVTVNVPSDMEVSTEECDGKITINVQHKEEKVEKQKLKNGDIIYVQEIAGGYIAIFQNMWDDVIDVHASLCLKTGLIYTNLNGAEILIRKNILSIRLATDEEQKQLLESLAKQKKLIWNIVDKKFEEYRVRLKRGDRYWHITELGTAISSSDYYSPYDNTLYELRNYFETKELANKALPLWKEFFKNLNIK